MSEKPTPQPAAEQDSIGKAVRRGFSPAHAASLLRRGMRSLTEQGAEATGREIAFRVNLMLGRDTWQHRADLPLRKELRAQRRAQFAKMPCISVVVPLYNTPVLYLRQMAESVLGQSYTNLELVLVDASDREHAEVGAYCKGLTDERVNYVRLAKNGGISSNTNLGFAEANGDYLALLDHDDTLQKNALYEVVRAINETGADFLYSDEIVLGADLKTLREYHFKPDFSPDTLRGCNYITHFSVFCRELLQQAGGGERAQFDGAQDYDLILRLTEQAKVVHHIPKVLYFWRSHALSTASDISAKPYAIEAGAKAIAAQLQRLGLPGTVAPQEDAPGSYRVTYELTARPLVSVLIPNKDHTNDLRRCLDSLVQKAGYKNLELLVIENNSVQAETFAFYENELPHYPNCRLLTYKGPFNFSAINNFAARAAKGEQLLLLNNDIELLSDGFITELLMYAQRPDVGAVGAKLYYPDDKIQHAGVFIGLGGSAGHSHKGLPRDNKGNLYRLSTAQNMSAVTGACLMVKTELYRKLGGLDEQQFAVSYNDVDFCLRLRQAGYLNVFTPYAEAYHYESKSRGLDTGGPNARRYQGERERFCKKYEAMILGGDPYYNPHFTLLYENYGYR
ncbi:MAG: glycosyltransferase family 2 protein [Pygmaiobacter sp.]|nr:glycosyltransferase family 2 protein [Pygmaiobacter sp.]